MAEKKRGLGRGLDSLIPPVKNDQPKDWENSRESGSGLQKQSLKAENSETKEQKDYITVKISKVEPDKTQPRKIFPEDSLNELAASIKDVGLIEPLIVTENESTGTYTIVAGERRWRACRLAGIKEVPVIIRTFSSDQEKIQASLIENIQREDLNPIDEALAYQRLIEEFGLKQEDVAEKVHKNRSSVANAVRLLKLSDPVKNMVAAGKLSMGHARALIPVEDAELQLQMAELIIKKELSVREAEKLVAATIKEKPEKKPHENLLEYREIAGRMNESLGMKVGIQPKGKSGGKVTIEFTSSDDLEKLMDRLISIQE